MRKLIYHVAITLDYFIAHEDGSIGGFLEEGDHIPDFIASWKNYDTVLMGKQTYEFGYEFGIQPGKPAYPGMKHYIFSKTIPAFEANEWVEIVREDAPAFVRRLKEENGKPIWLCGGGNFAGALLEAELIDELILKVNPVRFGSGIPMFGKSKKQVNLTFLAEKFYESGVFLLTYKVEY